MTRLILTASNTLMALLASSALLLLPTVSYAQANTETSDPDIADSSRLEPEVSEPELEEQAEIKGLEEIVVTTRKTSENLQEVPLAITALSEDDIERLNIQDLTDVTQQDTSVQFDKGFTPSDTRITIRGLSPTRGRPNAATLVDGIDLTSEGVSNAGGSTLINPRLIDIQRIEIVKGPQSSLFGRSAFAGAVQYITKDPSDVLEGDVFVSGNNEYDNEIRGSVSIPINDELGVLLNGYGWNSQGYYKNIATNDYVGGGDGAGGSMTFKWEPTDTLGIKWRTEYSRDYYDPVAQSLLNSENTIVDLGTLTPGASTCNATANADGQLLAGPLDDGDCEFKYQMVNGQIVADFDVIDPETGLPAPTTVNETFQLNQFFANPPAGSNLGQYDPNNPANFAQYDKTIVSFFKGEIPDAGNQNVTLTPNYRSGPGATNPVNAQDYDGTDSEVFRSAVKVDWAINDNLDILSNSSYLNSTVKIQMDLGKSYVDNCSPNIASLFTPYNDTNNINPLPNGANSYAEAILAANPGYTQADLAKFAPCTLMTPDGVNDGGIQFVQDDDNSTEQISQEFRLAWQASETINVVGGLQYWQERVDLTDTNSTIVAAGTECFLNSGSDVSQNPFAAAFLQVDSFQNQCGNTSVISAYYMADTYAARLADPTYTERDTDHYSAYGSLEWNLTEKFTTRVEARRVHEDNSVTGQLITPCLNGEPFNSVDASLSGCPNGPTADKNLTANGGQATGPNSVILCGQNGRCDRLGLANTSVADGGSPWYAGNIQTPPNAYSDFNGNSWWAFGYQPTPSNQQSLDRTDNYWTPKATVEYYWTDEVMTYASWSRGIKPGGFSLLTTAAFGLDANLDGIYDEIEFDPERLDVWEVGYKTTLADGRVRLNGSFFYQDFKDKQITVQKVTGGTVGTEVDNISGSEVRGLEVDLTWQMTDNWKTQVGYTLLSSEYTDYTIITPAAGDIARINAGNPDETCSELAVIPGSTTGNNIGCVMSYNGNELERAPNNAVLVNLSYTNNLFDTGYEWYGETNYRYQDSRYLEASNESEFKAYSLTDLRFGILADRWDVQLFVNNVFDSDTVISGGPSPGVPTGSFAFGFTGPPPVGQGINAGPKLPSDVFINLPDPRIIGISGKMRFGG